MRQHALQFLRLRCARSATNGRNRSVRAIATEAGVRPARRVIEAESAAAIEISTTEMLDAAARHKEDLFPLTFDSTTGCFTTHSLLHFLSEDRTARDAFETISGSQSVEGFYLEARRDSANLVLDPGSLVEIAGSSGATTVHAVVLCDDPNDPFQSSMVVLTDNGRISSRPKAFFTFVIPGAVSRDLASQYGLAEVAQTESEVAARVSILKHIRTFMQKVDSALEWTESRCLKINLYKALAQNDPHRWGVVTAYEAASLLQDKRPDLYNIFAMHKFLIADPMHFVAAQDTKRFHIRPRYDVGIVKKVIRWCRMPESPIDSFVAKARIIIERQSRAYLESANQPWTYEKGEHEWTADDRTIVELLIHYYNPPPLYQENPLAFPAIDICRRLDLDVDVDTGAINSESTKQLLEGIGVLAPWDPPIERFQSLFIDSRAMNMDKRVEKNLIEENVRRANRPLEAFSLSSPLRQHHSLLHLRDPLEDVRYDFKDMRVFVIDDPNSEELDDGVSAEGDLSGDIWLHVHVSDPASVVPPGHLFAQSARAQLETIYLGHKSFPMLPEALLHHPKFGLSLGSSRTNGSKLPERVLTFSTCIDTSGNIKDYKVRAGLVHDIRVTTYDEVDAALGHPPLPYQYPVGDPFPSEVPTPNLSPEDLRQLKLMDIVRQRMIKHRFDGGVFHHSEARGISTLLEKPNTSSVFLEPTLHRGFPCMRYQVIQTSDADQGSRSMVAEAMKLAGRAASMFALDHDIPLIRRTNIPPLLKEGTLEKVLSMRRPDGYVMYNDLIKYIELPSSAKFTMEPAAHFALGIPDGQGYTMVTSPLRRFGDLLAHWQIHGALLERSKPVFDEVSLTQFT
ncbi:RNB-domain-containing protein [Fistulina hepatica ATCC 64428]|nr:RNB-domain-containing protein [Fistulina hepatica ATCC 64428]